MMSKSRAVLRHLGASLLVLAMIGVLVGFFWYPFPFLQFHGTVKFSLLLILVTAFIGPALTFVVYKTDLRAMRFDLAVIVLI